MSIVLVGSTSGSCTLQEQAVAGTTVLTLPTVSGTVSLDGPAFRAFMSAAQSITGSTYTKLQFNSEVFDTNNNFDSTTNYRFTPTVAGYYQIQSNIYSSITAQLYVYKNGVADATGMYLNSVGHFVNDLVFLNGSTDYVEIYILAASGFTTANNSSSFTQFSGCLVRAS